MWPLWQGPSSDNMEGVFIIPPSFDIWQGLVDRRYHMFKRIDRYLLLNVLTI